MKHFDLLNMADPAAKLEELSKRIHHEDYLMVVMDKDAVSIRIYWGHHDGEILEMETEEKPDLMTAVNDIVKQWVDQENRDYAPPVMQLTLHPSIIGIFRQPAYNDDVGWETVTRDMYGDER